MRNARTFAGIYGIVDRAVSADVVATVDAMLGAGIVVIQYRAKLGVERDVVAALHARTVAARATLIVNDDVEAAMLADGLHVGQEDLVAHDVVVLRTRLAGRALGISCANAAEASVAEAAGADYVGVGPFATTATKADAGSAIGAAGVAAVVAATRLPVVAIGGIGLEGLAAVAASGAAMAAVITAIAAARDPAAAAAALVARWAAVAP